MQLLLTCVSFWVPFLVFDLRIWCKGWNHQHGVSRVDEGYRGVRPGLCHRRRPDGASLQIACTGRVLKAGAGALAIVKQRGVLARTALVRTGLLTGSRAHHFQVRRSTL